MFVWLLLSSKFGFLVCLAGGLHIAEIERHPRLGVLGVDLMELTSLTVSRIVELLNLRVKLGSIFSLQAITGDLGDMMVGGCCGMTLFNGDEKSFRKMKKKNVKLNTFRKAKVCGMEWECQQHQKHKKNAQIMIYLVSVLRS